MSQVNKNLSCLKIEKNISMESINSVSQHNSNKYTNSNINLENINNIVQNLLSTIEKLNQENKEIKDRLKVLEENNNKLVKFLKDILKENKKLENSSIILSNNNNNQKKEIYNKVIFDDNFDPNALSLSMQNDSQNENQNYLTKIYKNFLKNKTKNKNNIEEELIHKKSKIENNEKDLELDNLFYSDKNADLIYDDVGLFSKNGEKLNQIPSKFKKENNEYFNMKKEVLNIDEYEKEKNKIIKNISKNNFDINKSWSINQSSNMIGACINNESKDKKNTNNINEFVFLKDESKDDEYMF